MSPETASSMNSDAFDGLRNLRVLRLSLNRIVDLDHDAFQNLMNLEELDLSNNLVRSIAVVWFLAVPMLNVLNLDGNQIETFSLFSSSTSQRRRLDAFALHTLSLRKNRITTIEPAITAVLCGSHDEFFDLRMDGNPSSCSCTSCSCEFFTQQNGLSCTSIQNDRVALQMECTSSGTSLSIYLFIRTYTAHHMLLKLQIPMVVLYLRLLVVCESVQIKL